MEKLRVLFKIAHGLGFLISDIHSPEKLTKNSTRPYVDEIPTNFIHEIKRKSYDVIGINVFHTKYLQLCQNQDELI